MRGTILQAPPASRVCPTLFPHQRGVSLGVRRVSRLFVGVSLEDKAIPSAFFGYQVAPGLKGRQLLSHSGDVGAKLLRRSVRSPGLGKDLLGAEILIGTAKEECQTLPFTFRDPNLG